MKTFKKTHAKKTAGFSLAEMMVVIVIIGLLAGLVVPNVMAKLAGASVATAKSDINAINNAVREYAINNGGRFPDSLEELLDDGMGNSYFTKKGIPKDPWDMEYQYDAPSSPGEEDYRIYTLGFDGIPGGDGKNKDLDQNGEEEE
jgi:general secretion pathway protein G